MAYLGKKGYTIYKNSYPDHTLIKIRNELNVQPESNQSFETKEYPIYRESEQKMYLPRYYGLKTIGPFDNKLSTGLDISLKFEGNLFEYQNNIIDKYIKHVGSSGGGLLDVEPGKGKTVMALNIISKLQKKTLVIVHKTFLMNQWLERIQTFLPNAKIGKIQGDIIDIENKDIVLGMLQSLSNKKYDSTIWDEFGLCIFDECHHLSAEVFSNIMINVVTNYNLGLSGTMTRKDGLTKVFEYFIGPVVHKEVTDITCEVLVKSIKYHNDTMFDDIKTDFRGNPMYSIMINRLNCDDRNTFIVNIVRNELNINNDQQIMILAHTKTLIEELFIGITEFETSIGYYVGGMKEDKLKQSESKKIILGTYAMASEGLDIKTLTTLIMATPKSDVCQSVGRILRSKHSSPLVIDIIDPHIIFKNQYKKRCTYYKSKKYVIQQYSSTASYLNNIIKNENEKQTQSTCLIKL
jgi:superfamily II DNA or RNA helicase